MAVPLIMVRILPPEQMGIFKIFFLYVLMMPAFSMTNGLTNGLGYWAGQGDRGLRAIRMSNSLINLIAVALTFLMLLASPLVAAIFHWPFMTACLFAFSIWGAVCLTFLEESSIVTGKIWFGAIYLSSTEILRSALLVVTALVTRSLDMILLVASLSAVAKVTASLILAKRRGLIDFTFGGFFEKDESKKVLFQDIWKYAFPVSVAGVFGVFVTSSDQIILSHVLQPAQFALYAIGCLSLPPIFILEQSVTRVMIPQLSAAFAERNTLRAAHSYRGTVDQLAWLIIPAVTGLIVFAEPIIQLLFTAQYLESAQYLPWFALGYLLLIFPTDAVPRARGEGQWILRASLIFSPLSLILCFALGSTWGAFGALAAILIAKLALKIYAVYYIRTSTKWSWSSFIPQRSIAIYLITSVLLALLIEFAQKEFHLFAGSLNFFVYGFAFILMYFPLAFFFSIYGVPRERDEGVQGNVLLFTQHLGIGGLERLVLNLAKDLRSQGKWKPFVFSHDSAENAQNYSSRSLVGEFLKHDIPVDALQKGAGFSLHTVYRLLRCIHVHEIDIIHSHDMGTLIYAVFAKLLTLGRVRLVHTQHSFVHLARHKRYALYEKFFTRFVDTLTVVNESLVSSYEALGVSRNKIQVISNGVTFPKQSLITFEEKIQLRRELLAELRASQKLASLRAPLPVLVVKDHWLLYMARLHSVKGQRKAAELWSALNPAIRRTSLLWIVGPEAQSGEQDAVLKAFEAVPNRDRVIFIDGTQNPQQWLNASDLSISCSQVEGMPMGPIEALGSGLPVVLSEIEGHEFLRNQAKLFPLSDLQKGAAAIESTLSVPDYRSPLYYYHLWRASRGIRQEYSLAAMTEKYAQAYSTHATGKST